jgi:predicted ATP-grasp superfamily ATP-dependent carboligase
MSTRRVLIGFAGALSAPEVAWSLESAGYEVHAFARRGRRPPLRRSSTVRLHELAAPEEDVDAALTELGELLRALRPDALMPLDDASVWLCAELPTVEGAVLVGPSGPRAELTLDKRLQMRAAAEAGLPVPPTRVCSEPEDAFAEPLEYPVMLRPAFAIGRQGNRLRTGPRAACAGPAELERAAESYRDGTPFLVQPYVAGVGEGLFGIALRGEVAHWSAHRRVRMMSPQGSGSSACVSIPVDEELKAGAAAMLSAAGWDGIFMVELLRDGQGRPWFVELNGRAWGSMALARRLGLEYPAWAVATSLGDSLPAAPPPPPEPLVCRHLGRELVHLLIVMRGRPSEALSLWPKRRRTLRAVLSFRRRDRWYNLRRGDVALFIDDTVGTVGKEIVKALRP